MFSERVWVAGAGDGVAVVADAAGAGDPKGLCAPFGPEETLPWDDWAIEPGGRTESGGT